MRVNRDVTPLARIPPPSCSKHAEVRFQLFYVKVWVYSRQDTDVLNLSPFYHRSVCHVPVLDKMSLLCILYPRQTDVAVCTYIALIGHYAPSPPPPCPGYPSQLNAHLLLLCWSIGAKATIIGIYSLFVDTQSEVHMYHSTIWRYVSHLLSLFMTYFPIDLISAWQHIQHNIHKWIQCWWWWKLSRRFTNVKL